MTYDIPRPTGGDIVELILDDHRLFEDLLRECRRDDRDRAAAREALAELLVAHAEAEEAEVYPKLHSKRAITAHEEEHGEEEHAEVTEALLAFVEAKGTDTQKYEDALEKLAKVVNHHSCEEELTILNPAREQVSDSVRHDVGVAWATMRNTLLENGCASRDQVAALLRKAEKEGAIPPPAVRERQEAIEEDAKKRADALAEDA